jgi:hypothetical protein
VANQTAHCQPLMIPELIEGAKRLKQARQHSAMRFLLSRAVSIALAVQQVL